MKNHRLLLRLAAAPLLAPLIGGCLKAPPTAPVPTPVPSPTPPYFDPRAGQTVGKPLNVPNDPVSPDAFRITGALSGDRISIQSIDTVQAGNPPKPVVTLGTPDTVRLAGIVAPTREPGLQAARNAITNWTAGKDVDVSTDLKFPTDIEGVRIVQVIFKGGKGPFLDQPLSLNRMLVRSGNAVVDLYSPTSFDTMQWLSDEAYARRHKLGFWKFGVAIQQRVPIKLGPITGSKSTVTIVPTARGGAKIGAVATGAVTTQTTRTTSTRTTTSSVPTAATIPTLGATPAAGG